MPLLGTKHILQSLAEAALVVEHEGGAVRHWNCAAEALFGHEALSGGVVPLSLEMHARFVSELAAFRAAGAGAEARAPIVLEARGRAGEPLTLVLRLCEGVGAPGELAVALFGDAPPRDLEAAELQAGDASEQRRELRELQDRERRLRDVFNQTYQFIGMLTPDGRILDINQTALQAIGQSLPALVGRPFWEAEWWTHSPELQARLKAAIRAGAEGRFDRFEATHETIDGRLLTIDFSLKPLKDEQGRVYLLLPEGRDISERKDLEKTLREQYEQLKELDRLKSDFLNAVTHDLRTPLTAILGYIELLQEMTPRPLAPTQQEFLRQLETNSKRLEWMVNDLLDVGRVEAGTFHLNTATTDLGSMLRNTSQVFKPQIEAAGLRLVLSLPDEPLQATMDPERIERVLFNLLGNAIKFTPPGGRIRLAAEARADGIYCEVQDTGAGIAPEDLPRLFRRFSQLELGKRQKGGTGLGLSISKAIVEAHGGQIGVLSKPEQGSTFWFWLPFDGGDLNLGA